MNDFNITIGNKTFQGELQQFGHSYRIIVFIDDIPVSFEPDEERNFRAIVPLDQIAKVDATLLKKIAAELETSLK